MSVQFKGLSSEYFVQIPLSPNQSGLVLDSVSSPVKKRLKTHHDLGPAPSLNNRAKLLKDGPSRALGKKIDSYMKPSKTLSQNLIGFPMGEDLERTEPKKELRPPQVEIEHTLSLALNHFKDRDYLSVIDLCTEELEQIRTELFPTLRAKLLLLIIASYNNRKEYHKGMKYFPAMNLVVEKGIETPILSVLMNELGFYFYNTGNREKGIESWEIGLDLIENNQLQNFSLKISLLHNIFKAFMFENKYEQIIKCEKQLLDFFLKKQPQENVELLKLLLFMLVACVKEKKIISKEYTKPLLTYVDNPKIVDDSLKFLLLNLLGDYRTETITPKLLKLAEEYLQKHIHGFQTRKFLEFA